MSDTEKLMTAPELAQALGVNVASVYRHAEARKYPCYKIGGVFRFRLSEVLAATRNDKAAVAAKEEG